MAHKNTSLLVEGNNAGIRQLQSSVAELNHMLGVCVSVVAFGNQGSSVAQDNDLPRLGGPSS